MQAELNEAKMMAFGEKLISEIATMIFANLAYIGEKLGLFKLMAEHSPVTVQKLSEISSLHPRYLQEWLSAMAAAGWIEYNPENDSFSLPPEHAPFFAQEDHPMYVGGALELIGSYGETVHKVMECFRKGGGITLAEQHPDMLKIIDRVSTPLYTQFLTKQWIPQLLPRVHQKLSEGAEVADVGCGAGRPLVLMAHAYPNSHFTGYEPDDASAERAQELIAKEGLADRIQIVNAPSSEMPEGNFDFIITFDVVHDLAKPQEFINDVRRALKSDGTYLMMEFNCSSRLEENINPLGKLAYSSSTMYCLPFSLAHGGAGIGACMGEELPRQMCREAGFRYFKKLAFEHPFNVLYEIRV